MTENTAHCGVPHLPARPNAGQYRALTVSTGADEQTPSKQQDHQRHAGRDQGAGARAGEPLAVLRTCPGRAGPVAVTEGDRRAAQPGYEVESDRRFGAAGEGLAIVRHSLQIIQYRAVRSGQRDAAIAKMPPILPSAHRRDEGVRLLRREDPLPVVQGSLQQRDRIVQSARRLRVLLI